MDRGLTRAALRTMESEGSARINLAQTIISSIQSEMEAERAPEETLERLCFAMRIVLGIDENLFGYAQAILQHIEKGKNTQQEAQETIEGIRNAVTATVATNGHYRAQDLIGENTKQSMVKRLDGVLRKYEEVQASQNG